MKNHIEEPANIKSVSELAARLEAGEVFYDAGGRKYWFDANRRNPFRFESIGLDGCWDKIAQLKTRRECSWLEVEGALPVLCVVSDTDCELLIESKDCSIEIVTAVDCDLLYKFSNRSYGWKLARPATIEELKQYIKA